MPETPETPETFAPSDDQTTPLTVETMSRAPLQGRSRASFERMLAAARELMIESGAEDFTLQDVSQRGQVSIGSIYLRFESKDNLVRAVLVQGLADLAECEDAMMDDLIGHYPDLAEFLPHYVESYAEVLRVNAPLLRLAMQRAERDPLVAGPGKQAADGAMDKAAQALLRYRDQFGGGDPDVRARSAYLIIFATLARQLSLGSTRESVGMFAWDELKRELSRMVLAYLRSA